jgi:hypothetical protein
MWPKCSPDLDDRKIETSNLPTLGDCSPDESILPNQKLILVWSKLSHLIKSRIWVPGLPSPFGTKEGSFHQRPSQSFNSCCFANHKKHPNSKCSRVGSCSSKPRTRGSMIWPSATKIFRSNSANVICHTTPFC